MLKVGRSRGLYRGPASTRDPITRPPFRGFPFPVSKLASTIFTDPENLMPVAEFDTLPEAEEFSLVMVAMGVECWILESEAVPGRFQLWAASALAEGIRTELAAYAAEKTTLGISKPVVTSHPDGVGFILLWVLALLITYAAQHENPDLAEQGSNSGPALFDRGEWWRPLTALFLHADTSHLLGNLVYGFILFPLLAYSVGPRRGWLLALASGVAGNALSAWLHYPAAASSLGASTAIFGAIGILAGHATAIAWRTRSHRRLQGLLVPLGAGICLLGWLGSGDAPTDVLSHLLGFLTGTVLGAACGSPGPLENHSA